MTLYEQALRAGLEKQFGPDWWLIGASERLLQGYAKASLDVERERYRELMREAAVTLAHRMLGAGLAAGIVTEAK